MSPNTQLKSCVNVASAVPPDLLPAPTLVLQRQKEVWRLLCAGSPSYPGAVFSLYLGAEQLPVATHSAAVIHHQVTFSVPVQDGSVGLYQCQYSVLLGKKWSHSGRSLPLVLTKGELLKTRVLLVWKRSAADFNVHFMLFQDFRLRPRQVVLSRSETVLPPRLSEGPCVCLPSVCRGVPRGLAVRPGLLLGRDVVPLLGGGGGCGGAPER